MRKLLPILAFLFLFSLFINTRLVAQDTLIYSAQDTSKTQALSKEAIDSQQTQVQDTSLAKTFLEQGIKKYKTGAFSEAIEALNRAKAIYQESSLNVDKEHYTTLYWLGINHMSLNQNQKAVDSFLKGLVLIEKQSTKLYTDIAEFCSRIGYCYEYLGDYSRALFYKKRVLKIYLELELEEDDLRLGYAYNNLAASHATLGDYVESVRYLRLAEAIFLKRDKKEHGVFASIYMNLGSSLLELGKLNAALPVFQASLKYSKKYFGIQSKETASALNMLGTYYEAKKDFHKALENKREALRIRKTILPKNDPYIAFSYNNLATSYYYMQDFEKAIEFYEKALLQMQFSLGNNHYYTGMIHTGLGNALLAKKKYNKSIENYSKSLTITKTSVGIDHPGTATAYHNLAFGYQQQKQFNESSHYFDTALVIREKMLGHEHPLVALTITNLATNFRELGEYQKSNDYFEKALSILGFDGSNIYKGIKDHLTFIMILQERSRLNLSRYRHTNDKAFLNKTINDVEVGIRLIKMIGQNTSTNNYLSFISHFPIFVEIALSTGKLIGIQKKPNDYFSFLESSKSAFLKKQIYESNALHFADIPDSILNQEYDLRADITYYEKKLQEKISQGVSETDTNALAISSKVFALNRDYEKLRQQIEDKHALYNQLQYDIKIPSIEYVQDSLLTPKQSLVEYFLGESSLFIFLVQPNHYEVIEVPVDSSFQEQIHLMTKDGIFGNYALSKSKRGQRRLARTTKNYGKAAHLLYQQLIAPIRDHLPKNAELIIVPDGALGYVPFEALLTAEPIDFSKPQHFEYLIKDYQISYAYSATLLRDMRQRKHRQKPKEELLAMAPFFLGDSDTLIVPLDTNSIDFGFVLKDSLGALPASGWEVKKIARSWRGKAWYGSDASVDRFKQLAPNYRILHLSTHAEADGRGGDYAFLAFGLPDAQGQFAKFYARDLYNLSLNADMVVLSACETGSGQLQRGEGIVSLARAFAYAGAKSMLTTLWKVEEKSISKVATTFYKYLKKGVTKDRALRLAKLEYLKKHENDAVLSHPFFWAAMIGIGDMQPLR